KPDAWYCSSNKGNRKSRGGQSMRPTTPSRFALTLAALILTFVVTASAQYDVSVRVNDGANVFYLGRANTIEWTFTNPQALLSFSLGWQFAYSGDFQFVEPYGTYPQGAPIIHQHFICELCFSYLLLNTSRLPDTLHMAWP